jgi:hypothetical protein
MMPDLREKVPFLSFGTWNHPTILAWVLLQTAKSLIKIFMPVKTGSFVTSAQNFESFAVK